MASSKFGGMCDNFSRCKKHQKKWLPDDRFICKTKIISHGASCWIFVLRVTEFLLLTGEARLSRIPSAL